MSIQSVEISQASDQLIDSIDIQLSIQFIPEPMIGCTSEVYILKIRCDVFSHCFMSDNVEFREANLKECRLFIKQIRDANRYRLYLNS